VRQIRFKSILYLAKYLHFPTISYLNHLIFSESNSPECIESDLANNMAKLYTNNEFQTHGSPPFLIQFTCFFLHLTALNHSNNIYKTANSTPFQHPLPYFQFSKTAKSTKQQNKTQNYAHLLHPIPIPIPTIQYLLTYTYSIYHVSICFKIFYRKLKNIADYYLYFFLAVKVCRWCSNPSFKLNSIVILTLYYLVFIKLKEIFHRNIATTLPHIIISCICTLTLLHNKSV
jgi:hypothetical protein